VNPSDLRRAVAAARSVAGSLGLRADDAVVLHNSNRIAVRMLPCDVLARVATAAHENGAAFEVEIARRLADAGAPVAAVEPTVPMRPYLRDGFVVTLWTYYESRSAEAPPREYAHALEQLHASMRRIDMPVPHFTDRVAEARGLLAGGVLPPYLSDADRRLLRFALETLPGTLRGFDLAEQVLHGEPHPGNVLATEHGLLFIDVETCCRGPVEFDIAHAPVEVGAEYAGADPDALRVCRTLTLALAAAWRFEPDDELPNAPDLGRQWLGEIRAALESPGASGGTRTLTSEDTGT
jgi:hypothetical protein